MLDLDKYPQLGWFLTFFAIPYGAIFGSFLNMAIYRVPRHVSIVRKTRSFCPKCDHVIAWYHNIPIISYLVLRGRCAYCGKPIPVRYLLVELVTAASTMLISYYCLVLNPGELGLPAAAVLTAFSLCGIALFFIDLELYLLPDVFTHIPLAVGLLSAWWLPQLHYSADPWAAPFHFSPAGAESFNALIDAVLGALFGGMLVWTLGAVGALVKKVEAMGEGDILLMAALGSLLGWKLIILTLVAASFLGAVVGLAGMLLSRLRTGETKKTIIFEESEEIIEAGEPPHIAWVRKMGTVRTGWLLLVPFGAAWVFAWTHLGVPVAGIYMEGYGFFMLAPLFLGTIMSAFMVLFGLVARRLEKEGRWIKRDIEHTEDGRVREKLEGHYMPFGPPLLVCGLVLSIWGPAVVERAAAFYLGDSRRCIPLKTPWTEKRNKRVNMLRIRRKLLPPGAKLWKKSAAAGDMPDKKKNPAGDELLLISGKWKDKDHAHYQGNNACEA